MHNNSSVSRRKFIFGVSVAGTISIAGCSGGGSKDGIADSDGDGLIDGEDYAPNDPDVQEKSDVQETEVQTEQLVQEASTEYDAGVNDFDSAEGDWGTGNDHFVADDFEGAKSAFQTAREGYVDSKQHFETATDLSVTLENQDAQNIARNAQKEAETSVTATNKVINAMDAAIENGTNSEAFSRADQEARDYLEKTENDEYEIAGIDTFKSTLRSTAGGGSTPSSSSAGDQSSPVAVAKKFLLATAAGNTRDAKNLLHPEAPEGEAGEIDSLAEAFSGYQVEITDSKIVERTSDGRVIVELVFALEGGKHEGDDLTFRMQKGESGWFVYDFTDE